MKTYGEVEVSGDLRAPAVLPSGKELGGPQRRSPTNAAIRWFVELDDTV
jgi:hypothetical protein